MKMWGELKIGTPDSWRYLLFQGLIRIRRFGNRDSGQYTYIMVTVRFGGDKADDVRVIRLDPNDMTILETT